MQVPVRELKDHLSHYLRLIKKGESIIITSHHVPLAKISAIPQTDQSSLHQLLQTEDISWNGKKPKGNKNGPVLKGTFASDYVLEDRR